MSFKTKREATSHWISEFSSVDTEMIRKLMMYEPDDWQELLQDEDSYDTLPMWGTMWQMNDSCDTDWIENHDGIEALKECGFRVYESETFGIFFGVDGCGYDFYEPHWIPLYEKRGLHWSDEDYNELE